MATSLRARQAEPRRDGDVSLQDHHRPASSCSDSAQSEDRSQNRLQRAQQNDQPRHADLRPYQIRLEAEGEMQPKPHSCTNARPDRSAPSYHSTTLSPSSPRSRPSGSEPNLTAPR